MGKPDSVYLKGVQCFKEGFEPYYIFSYEKNNGAKKYKKLATDDYDLSIEFKDILYNNDNHLFKAIDVIELDNYVSYRVEFTLDMELKPVGFVSIVPGNELYSISLNSKEDFEQNYYDYIEYLRYILEGKTEKNLLTNDKNIVSLAKVKK